MGLLNLTKPKIIFVSNRLPFNLNPQTGELERGNGGLVSGLLGVYLDEPFYWSGFETSASSAARLVKHTDKGNPHLRLHPVVLDKELYSNYYDKFSNDVLWPLFHYESENVSFHSEYWQSYIAANQRMADEILKVAGPSDTVWIHDFHFLLLPEMLKKMRPSLKIGLFLHIPFPAFEIYRQLPVREEILRGMTCADLVGFHDHSYLRHFGVSLTALLGIESSMFKAEIGDHVLHLGVYPISIDTEGYAKLAKSEAVQLHQQKLQEEIHSPFLMLGVDRLDYTKGLELKLEGFRRALEKYPELRGHVSLLQVAVPTRTRVPSYMKLRKNVERMVGAINGDFSQPGYVPVNYIFNSISETELLALYRRADCALITSKRDGMNLVAMEYSIAQNENDPGILILSEFAGAASMLSTALFINPWDEDSIADAIHRAFQMSNEERHQRMHETQSVLSRYSATQWAQSFLKDLENYSSKVLSKPTLRMDLKNNLHKNELLHRLAAHPKRHLILDYDGTLVALQRSPELAVVSQELRQLLDRLSKGFSIYLVSGRSQQFLDKQFPNCSFGLAAEHGGFYKNPGEEWRSRISTDIESWYLEVDRVMRSYAERVPLSFVEYKVASLVWHYRQSPNEFANYQARRLDEELQVGLANLPVSITTGSKVVEARAIECNKGCFVRWLMSMEQERALFIAVGDDRTDEDMFRVVGDKGISIKIGSGDTVARYRLKTQEEVLTLLQLISGFESQAPIALA